MTLRDSLDFDLLRISDRIRLKRSVLSVKEILLRTQAVSHESLERVPICSHFRFPLSAVSTPTWQVHAYFATFSFEICTITQLNARI